MESYGDEDSLILRPENSDISDSKIKRLMEKLDQKS